MESSLLLIPELKLPLFEIIKGR